MPAELNGVPELPAYVKNVFKYQLQLTFRSTYFNAIDYLKRLEQLSWGLYWDSLEYKVVDFPEGVVTVKLYVLNNKRVGA